MSSNINTKQVFGYIGVACVLVFLYSNVRSCIAYHHANAMLEKGHHQQAIDAYGESIRWYAPINLWNYKSVKKLQMLANNFQLEGLVGPAKMANLELRSSLSSVRGIYFPMFSIASSSSKKYVDLLISELSMLSSSSIDFKILKQKYMLNQYRHKHTLLSFLFVFWFISIAIWSLKAFDNKGQFYPHKVNYAWSASNIVVMGLWLCLLIYL
ncbi:hypothetical protein MRY82_05785 [bacterium]|nr:hypothetical protein [bacterium]